ncbi:MAG TPA: spherulation-specific family 4 protein [Pirellulales bacterium]|nr:spherulation-specific family 4 protein [Pirellulales bacterium]
MRCADLRLAWLVLLTAWAPRPDALAAEPPLQPKPAATISLLVPAYFYPAGEGLKDWNRLIAAAAEVPIVAIANPASGPGEKPDPNHAMIIGRAARAGVTVVGYVGTVYAKKPLAQAKAEVDRWMEFYPAIGGFFFDEQASDGEQLAYYRELFDYARQKTHDGLVASNPGVPCDVAYINTARADVVCIFENERGYDDFTPPTAWQDNERRHAAAVPFRTADTRQMHDRLRRAVELKLGYFYATDDVGPNPWDRLPTYWDDEVAAIRALTAAHKPRKS